MEAEDILEMCEVQSRVYSPSPSCSSSDIQGGVISAASSRISDNLNWRSKRRFMKETRREIASLNKRLKMLEGQRAQVIERARPSCSSDTENWRQTTYIGSHDSASSVDTEGKANIVKDLLCKHRIVAVVGMGGIGKSHLLNHVFTELRSSFEESIWVTVSSTYSIRRLQFDVLRQLHVETSPNIADEVRARDITDKLKGRRCLIVMNDIWNLRDNERHKYRDVQDKLERVGIPLEADCCRILVSTREDPVAHVLRAEMYRMPLLSPESGKEMFLKDISAHFDDKDPVAHVYD